MIIAEINTLAHGSTGKIMLALADVARKNGETVYTYSAKNYRRTGRKTYSPIDGHTYYAGEFSNILHKCFAQATGLNGCGSILPTVKLIQKMKQEHVELIHLHNLHEFCINIPLLFRYIKKNKIKVVWTLHDCWAFTGHCTYFTMVKCNKWKTGCGGCSQLREYPISYMDTTALMWKKKKAWFTGVDKLEIVTPSEWLASLVRQSYLGEYNVHVIHNGIDLSTFCPTESNFKEKNNIRDKFVLLGVAFEWDKRKGLDVFIELSHRLEAERFQIVLIGTDEAVDSKLPDNIISIHRTHNQRELAEIYSAADLFVNPTREDNYPTVNMEAIACGTPVLTFKTGGSPEIVDDSTGIVVDCDDVDAIEEQIRKCEASMLFEKSNCVEKAKEFDQKLRFMEYVELYKEL